MTPFAVTLLRYVSKCKNILIEMTQKFSNEEKLEMLEIYFKNKNAVIAFEQYYDKFLKAGNHIDHNFFKNSVYLIINSKIKKQVGIILIVWNGINTFETEFM